MEEEDDCRIECEDIEEWFTRMRAGEFRRAYITGRRRARLSLRRQRRDVEPVQTDPSET